MPVTSRTKLLSPVIVKKLDKSETGTEDETANHTKNLVPHMKRIPVTSKSEISRSIIS